MVGAAIVVDARVLAARRTTPAEAAGRWELPGGKVEPGESPADALVREIGEELGCTVALTGWLPGESTIRDGLVLRIGACDLVAGTPEPAEHDAVCWLGEDELDDLDWLDSDRPFLPAVRDLLRGTS